MVSTVLLVIVIVLLIRNPKNRLNQVILLFYISSLVGFSTNFVYVTFTIESLENLASFLNILSIYFACFSMGVLLLFLTLLNNPRMYSNTTSQIGILFIYTVTLLALFFIPEGSKVEILEDGTQLSPVWNLPFTMYVFLILIITFVISLFQSHKVYKMFSNPILAKKFKYFVLGLLILHYLPMGATFANFLNIYIVRVVYSITAFFVNIGFILIYLGIGVSIKEQNFNVSE